MTDEEVVALALPNSKQTRERLLAWCRALRAIDAEGVAGDVVECGVYRGASIVCARLISPERRCWLYDTFAGMTKPGPEDVSRSGKKAIEKFNGRGGKWMDVSVEEVASVIHRAGGWDYHKLKFVEGDVCCTLLQKEVPDKIAALRLDTDWYASTREELKVLFPRLEKGGVLVVDDYGYWRGSKKATDEYFGENFVARNFEDVDGTAVSFIRR